MRKGRQNMKGINKVELIKGLSDGKAKEKDELKMTSGHWARRWDNLNPYFLLFWVSVFGMLIRNSMCMIARLWFGWKTQIFLWPSHPSLSWGSWINRCMTASKKKQVFSIIWSFGLKFHMAELFKSSQITQGLVVPALQVKAE